MRLPALGLLGLFLIAGTSRARADELTATLETVRGPQRSTRITIRGRATKSTPGALVHLTLRLGAAEALFARAAVGPKGRFAFSYSTRRTVAPGTYEGRVELILSTQLRGVREQLRREYGWPVDHRELVGSTKLVVGTPAVARKHRRAILIALQDVATRTGVALSKAVALSGVPAASSLAWPPFHAAARKLLRTLSREVDRVRDPWWVLWKGSRVDLLRGVLSSFAQGLRRHQAGDAKGAQLLRAAHTRLLRLLIEYRRELGLPVPAESGPLSRVSTPGPSSLGSGRARKGVRPRPKSERDRSQPDPDPRCTCGRETHRTGDRVLCDFAPHARRLPTLGRLDVGIQSKRSPRARRSGGTPIGSRPGLERPTPVPPGRRATPPAESANTVWLGLILFGAIGLGLFLVGRDR